MMISAIMKANAIGEQMRQVRFEAGLSLRELANKANTSHATLLAYEKGLKSPSISTWLRIMEAAGYSVNLQMHRRIREKDGIKRSEELAAVLGLAEQFPAKVPRYMDYPIFSQAVRNGTDQ